MSSTRSTRSRTRWMISSGMRPTNSSRSTRHSAHLLERTFARRCRLLLLANARLVVVLAALELAENARLLALLLEPLHRDFERLVVADLDHGHSERSPLHADATSRAAMLAPCQAQLRLLWCLTVGC